MATSTGQGGGAATEADERLARANAVVGVLVALDRLLEEPPGAVVLAQGQPGAGGPVEEPGGRPARRPQPCRRFEELRGDVVATGAVVAPAHSPRRSLHVTALRVLGDEPSPPGQRRVVEGVLLVVAREGEECLLAPLRAREAVGHRLVRHGSPRTPRLVAREQEGGLGAVGGVGFAWRRRALPSLTRPFARMRAGPKPPAADRDAQAAGAEEHGPREAAAAEAKAAAKPPARPVSEIRADIEKERAELSRSFETLRDDLDEAVDAGKQRAADTGRKAKIAGPVAEGVVASLVVARMVFKRRSRREK